MGLAPWLPAPKGLPVRLASRADASAPVLGGGLPLELSSLGTGGSILPADGEDDRVSPPPLSTGRGAPEQAGVLMA